MKPLEEYPVVGIMGSRTIDDPKTIATIDRIVYRAQAVVSGGARGVDTLAEESAKRHGKLIKVFPVEGWEWDHFGKRSGVFRNEIMALYLKLHGGCAFIFIKEGSKGAASMAKLCDKYGIPHKVFKVE